MTDYKESSVTGQQSQHQRCYQIIVNNPHDSAPTVRFDEELLLTLPDGTKMNRHVGGMTIAFDPTKLVPIRNPLTWELTGQSVTMGEIYSVLASAYWQAALERDAG